MFDPNVPMVTAEGNLMILEVNDNYIPSFISDIMILEPADFFLFSMWQVGYMDNTIWGLNNEQYFELNFVTNAGGKWL